MNPKESPMQKTITIAQHPNKLLANAVLHLANALDNPCGIAGVGPSCEAARDLVRDLAAPDHAGRPSPAPRGPIIHVRETRTRPDSTLEVREWLSSPKPSTAPAPSCDAPHCACAEGEDCHANGVAGTERVVVGVDVNKDGLAATAWTITRVDCPNVGDVLRLSDGREVIQFAIPAAMGYDAMKEALHMVWRELDVLAGKARDAQRHESYRVMVRAVSPAYPGPDVDRDTWALDPDATGHRAPFSPGDLVIRSSGREGIHRIVDVTVDGDAPRHRSLRITVEPTDVVVDQDAF